MSPAAGGEPTATAHGAAGAARAANVPAGSGHACPHARRHATGSCRHSVLRFRQRPAAARERHQAAAMAGREAARPQTLGEKTCSPSMQPPSPRGAKHWKGGQAAGGCSPHLAARWRPTTARARPRSRCYDRVVTERQGGDLRPVTPTAHRVATYACEKTLASMQQ